MNDALRDLATLALALAYGPDRHLTTREVELLVDRLHARHPELPRADVQALVVGQLEHFTSPRVADAAAARLAAAPVAVRQAALADLSAVAQADGLVHRAEGALVGRLARQWGLDAPEAPPQGPAPDALLVDLALLCVALAYGADRELSDDEARLIRRHLAAWAALATLSGPDAALDAALLRYATGHEKGTRHAAIRRLRQGLSAEVRAAVLRDLTQLANADGRFLDEEESLLSYLSTTWNAE